MTKRLIEIDDEVLASAQAELATSTMKETVNEALRRAGRGRSDRVAEALDHLARRPSRPADSSWH